ncbi:TIGR03086 family metal-binding protein [Longispora albida]|uniref:TIGR03086 family metal-binding protein n=1 Tax=Longispora albida TaxID=203523 RepID=UPI0003608FA3|nr:TIGR03086 family metal-binding protein [Longispora albida]
MTSTEPDAALTGGVSLLERAITYLLGSLHRIGPDDMSRPTPCGRWDLCALLVHVSDSLLTLQEAIGDRSFSSRTRHEPPATITQLVRTQATSLLGAWVQAPGSADLVYVAGGRPVTATLVAATGALELAVHGWDIAQACGAADHPIPALLADELLELSALFVTAAERPGQFAPPVLVPPAAGPADRLVAFLGRVPLVSSGR